MVIQSRSLIILIFIIFSLSIGYAQEKQDLLAKEEIRYKAEGLKDPFEPSFISEKEKIPEEKPVGISRVSPLPKLSVQGIIWNTPQPLAIINNQVLKKGDTIDQVKIIDIDKEGITIIYAGGILKLPAPAAGKIEGEEK